MTEKPASPGALTLLAHTLVALVQHVQTVLGFHILGLYHLELSNGRGQKLNFLQEPREKGSAREPRKRGSGRGGGTWDRIRVSLGKETSPTGRARGRRV